MILIVDDDNAVRMSIGLALKRAGYESLATSTEEEVLHAVRDMNIKVVILDMNLTLTTTGQDGVEMLQKIRILRPEMPVILITAWGTIPLAVKAMNLGAFDFMTKPWSNVDLVANVRRALRLFTEKESTEPELLEDIERHAITEALRHCDGNLSEAAARLGITRQALYRRIEKFKL